MLVKPTLWSYISQSKEKSYLQRKLCFFWQISSFVDKSQFECLWAQQEYEISLDVPIAFLIIRNLFYFKINWKMLIYYSLYEIVTTYLCKTEEIKYGNKDCQVKERVKLSSIHVQTAAHGPHAGLQYIFEARPPFYPS